MSATKFELPYDPNNANERRRYDQEFIDWFADPTAISIAKRDFFDAEKSVKPEQLASGSYRLGLIVKADDLETLKGIAETESVSLNAIFFAADGTRQEVDGDPIRVVGARGEVAPQVLASIEIPHGKWREWQLVDASFSAALLVKLQALTNAKFGITLLY